IWVKGAHVTVTPLSTPATRITVSNGPPFVPNDAITKELKRFGHKRFSCLHKSVNTDSHPSVSNANINNTDHHTEDKEGEGSVQVNGATEEVKGQKESEARGSAEGVSMSTDAVQAGGLEEGLADVFDGSSLLTENSMRDEEQ
ncbi:hypothetical protein QTP86_030340, partial [Hemibagrus guttatus]